MTPERHGRGRQQVYPTPGSRSQDKLSQLAASPSDRFIMRRKEPPGSDNGYKYLPNTVEEGAADEENQSSYCSEALARDVDYPSPNSDESDRPRPGFSARFPPDVEIFCDDPDEVKVMPTVEEGSDPIIALQALRDDLHRGERRQRHRLIKAEDETRLLERQKAEQDQKRKVLTHKMYSMAAKRDNLQVQVEKQQAQLQAQNNQIQVQGQQIADLRARLNAALQH
ncbi:MAG: hypothetical protein Q9219_003072 [cf. Caloplaca sp. 3 TL-2023]